MISKAASILRAVIRQEGASSRVLASALTNVLLSGLALATGTIAARLLGPHGRGELAAIQLWGFLLYRLATLGLSDSLVYFSAKDRSEASRYLSSSLILILAAAIPAAFLAYLLIPTVLASQSNRIIEAARLYVMLFVPLYALVNLPIHALRGNQDFIRWNTLLLTRQIGWLTVLVAAWALQIFDPVFVALSHLGILAALAIFNLTLTVGRMGWSRPSARLWRPMLRFGLPSALSDTSELVNLRLDQLILVAILPSEQFGLYVAAVAWGIAARPFLLAVGNVLFPQVAVGLTARTRSSSFVKGTQAGSALSLLVFAALAPLTPVVVPLLLGDHYAEAVGPAVVLTLAGTIWGFNGILEEGVRGLGKPSIAMRAEVAGALATALLLILLVGRFDVMGAAFASAGGFAITGIALVKMAARESGNPATKILRPDFSRLIGELKKITAPPP